MIFFIFLFFFFGHRSDILQVQGVRGMAKSFLINEPEEADHRRTGMRILANLRMASQDKLRRD